MSLKQQTIQGLSWSFINSLSSQLISFVIGIILARLLTPHEFGLVGITTTFILISHTIVNSGFSIALIRKQACTQKDYSTVFYFNLVIALLLYLIIYLISGNIAQFFNEPELENLLKVLGLSLVIISLSIVQTTILSKRIDFKLQTKIAFIASIISGGIAVSLAFKGFGVWSLVLKTVINDAIIVVLLWIWNKWRPMWCFSLESFKSLFNFGYKLLISSVISSIYNEIYKFVIGKYISITELGFYTRAKQFQELPTNSLSSIIEKVTFPVLSKIQDDNERLNSGYKRIIKAIMLITFTALFVMAASAKALILVLIGEKWITIVPYLQLLCFQGMLYPLHVLNLNILNVKGKSGLFLKIEIIKKIFVIPILFVGIYYGIIYMIIGMIFLSFLAFIINGYWSEKLIGYSIIQQLKDITPAFFVAALVGIFVFAVDYFTTLVPLLLITTQLLLGGLLTVLFGELLKLDAYIEIKQIMFDQIKKLMSSSK